MQFYAKNKFYFLLILCFVILLLPLILRNTYDNRLLIGVESYNSLRFAEYIYENQELPIEDSFSYGARPYFREYGWPLILSISHLFLSKWLPLLLGLLSFILFYKIIQKINYNAADLASLFFIISPAFIYLFSTSNKYAMAITLSLLGFYFHKKNKEYLSIISFGILSFFSYVISIFILLIYLAYTLYNRKWKFFNILLSINIITFLLQFRKIFTLGLPETFFGFNEISISNILRILFSDFGSKNGISIFLLLLGLVGAYYMWKYKYKYLIIYIIFSIMIVLSFYFNFLIYYILMMISIFAAYAFLELINHEWKSNLLKFLTILVLLCGLLFSSLVHINRVPKLMPTSGFGDGLEFLKEQNITTTVFSHYTRGGYLSYTGKRNFMDDNFLYAPGVSARYRDMWRLFNSRDINEASGIINKYGIQYIWLDSELREELYGKTEKDLLFLLRYSPQNFKKVFDNRDVEIYKYENINLTKVR